jgi:hypothetical protein
VFGAYALYPGYFEQTGADNNPYQEAINEIDIGAFPLLPSQEGLNGSTWLSTFLKDKIGSKQTTYSTAVSDGLYLQDSARIPYRGLSTAKQEGLTITMPSAPKNGRTQAYVDGFINGEASWYHVPVTTVESKYERAIMFELQYIAIATIPTGHHGRQIEWIWPIKSVTITARSELTEVQAGSLKNSSEVYWLLKLGQPLKLKKSILNVPIRKFTEAIKLTTLDNLTEVEQFQDIHSVYTSVVKPF